MQRQCNRRLGGRVPRARVRAKSSTTDDGSSATLPGDVSSAGERIIATYRIETPLPPRRAAEVLAGEQSSGTFVAVPGESAELRERFRARVENVIEVVTVDAPALPGSRMKDGDA